MTDVGIVSLCLAFSVIVAWLTTAPNEEHVLVIGTPGSGKSVGCARDAVGYCGTAIILDPTRDSLARLVLTHADGRNILFDRLSDLEYPLGYELLKPSAHPNPERRRMQNQLRVQA